MTNRCIATNAAGSTERIAVITVGPKANNDRIEYLSVMPESVTIDEGQNTKVTCTGSDKIPVESIKWSRFVTIKNI